MKKATACLTLIILSVFPGSTGFAAPGSVPVLGQVISSDMTMDGVSVPSGTTLLNETRLQTGSYPAAIHLGNGPVLELGENSSAYFERLPSGEVQVSVETGSLSLSEEGEVRTVSADRQLTIPHRKGQPVAVQEQGVVAVLVENAATGTLALQVDDASRIDPSKSILVKSADGVTQEVHSIASIQGTTITVRAGLTSSFQAQDLIIQGDRVEAVAAAAGGAAPAGQGLSTAALVAIFGGAGGAAGAIVYAVKNGEDEPSSPITP